MTKDTKVWVPKFEEFEALYGNGSRNGTRFTGTGNDHVAPTFSLAVRARARSRGAYRPHAQFGPPELIEAARKEGKLVFYRPTSPRAKRR